MNAVIDNRSDEGGEMPKKSFPLSGVWRLFEPEPVVLVGS